MKRVKRWCLLVLCLSIGVAPGAQTPAPVVTVYYSDRPPFCQVDGQTGPLIDLAKAVLTEAGLRGRFIELPPERIVDLLWRGPDDALALGWYRNPAREAFGRYSPPLYQEQPMVAVVGLRAATSLRVPVRWASLLGSGLTLGVPTGRSLGPVVDQKVRAQGLVPLETSNGIQGLLRLVAEGRMDYTLLPGEEARYYVDRDPELANRVQIIPVADALAGNLRYLFFPASLDPQVARRLDAAVDKVRQREALSPEPR